MDSRYDHVSALMSSKTPGQDRGTYNITVSTYSIAVVQLRLQLASLLTDVSRDTIMSLEID